MGIAGCIVRKMSGSDEFYDNDEVHGTYLRHRQRPDNTNDAIERPIFLELAGDLIGLDIVDLPDPPVPTSSRPASP